MPEKLEQSNINLRSEEVQEILTNPPVWIVKWGITLIFMFTAIILILAFVIEYPDFVSAKIIVTTEKPTEKKVARKSGQLDRLYVKDRDSVVIGQKLAVIKNTANIADVYFLKSIMDTLSPIRKEFTFSLDSVSGLILGDIEEAYINFEKSYIDFKLLKELEPYANQLRGNQQSIVEIKSRLEDQINQKYLLEQEYELSQTDLNRHKRLFDKGVISQQEYEIKKIAFIQLQKNISTMAITISQMREAIATGNQTLKSTNINKLEDDTRFLKNLSQSYNALRKSILDWEYNYVITSSIDGVISFQEFWGTNQFVDSGDVVFSILPLDTSKLIGKLRLPAQNAGKVTIGQKVLVKLDNFPYQQYGMLVGIVENMAISPNDEGNYIVYISLKDGIKTSYGQNISFNQELLGNAEIITEDLSVIERVFYKFKDIFKYQ